MFEQERWIAILDMLKTRSSLTVDEIVRELGASPATIRRDITKMAKSGLIVKKFGSIESINPSADIPDADRSFDPGLVTTTDPLFADVFGLEGTRKEAIARKAASLVRDDDVIFVGTGSSTYYMLDYVNARNVTVITTSLIHLRKVLSLGFQAYVLEGELNLDHDFIVATSESIQRMASYNITKTFLGTRGINVENGLSTSSFLVYQTKRHLIDLPLQHYVLVDSSKYGSRFMATWAKPDEVTLVTDAIPEDYAAAYRHILA